jgi:hypothetical protein
LLDGLRHRENHLIDWAVAGLDRDGNARKFDMRKQRDGQTQGEDSAANRQ